MIKISIEDIQKINNLVSELLKKGICSTREEAVKMAESYLNKQVISDKKTEVSKVLSPKKEDEYRNMIERTKTYMQKELMNLRNALEILAKEISKLKQEVNNLKIAGESKSVENTELEGKNVKEAAEEQEKLEEEEEKEEKKDKKFYPKQGKFGSEDVSVEKMFYYGNK